MEVNESSAASWVANLSRGRNSGGMHKEQCEHRGSRLGARRPSCQPQPEDEEERRGDGEQLPLGQVVDPLRGEDADLEHGRQCPAHGGGDEGRGGRGLAAAGALERAEGEREEGMPRDDEERAAEMPDEIRRRSARVVPAGRSRICPEQCVPVGEEGRRGHRDGAAER